jgi:hypothetical protein
VIPGTDAKELLPAVEAALRSACKTVQQDGYTIARRVTVDGKRCCAVGAMMITCELGFHRNPFDQIADRFGISGSLMSAFAAGFDSSYLYVGNDVMKDYRDLGKKLAAEFIG